MTGTGRASLLLAGLFAGHAGAACALEVDRIEILSRLGEPLRAEIPVSATAEELQTLQAQLAVPVTFARIGLARPSGVVADLRFAVVRDARGGAVIRVTSAQPVEEDFLTFLVQIDSGGERMVREYSVALAAADSLPAALPPPIRSAAMAGPDRIVRESEVAATQTTVGEGVAIPLAGSDARAGAVAMPPAPVAPIPLASTTAAPLRVPVPESAPKTPAAVKPAARPAPSPVAAASPVAHVAPAHPKPAPVTASASTSPAAGESVGVRSGDTLTGIASGLDRGDHTLDQMMLALVRANPQAFARGNINLLRRGAVLRVPSADALSRSDAAQAAVMVAEQIRQGRDGDMPAMHPASLTGEPSATDAAPAEAKRVLPPRLQIAPPSIESVATAFGASQSGLATAGEGRELRPETPADAPGQAAPVVQIEEMQARIVELESLQRDQQALIALQESALAAGPRSGDVRWGWIAAALAAVFALGWGLARWRLARRSVQAVSVQERAQEAATTRTSASSPNRIARQQAHPPTWHGEPSGNSEST